LGTGYFYTVSRWPSIRGVGGTGGRGAAIEAMARASRPLALT